MISAKIIADSVSPSGDRITTYELEYPRFIHSELMTHRLFSRNAASSRAIPIAKTIEQVRTNPATPIHWGMNQAGMQANEELEERSKARVQELWCHAAQAATVYAEIMDEQGAHKQIVNRILEPFVFMKTVVTATEYDNWFWLRCHADAQPEIKELADKMYSLYTGNEPIKLEAGDWHVPYYNGNYGNGVWKDSGYAREDGAHNFENTDWKRGGYTLNQALKISASCCAQVSFRSLDEGLEKAKRIYDRLVDSVPVHASPFEHQASPITTSIWENGMTHEDISGNYWSGNFKGWIQHRQLIKNNVCWNYEGE